MSGKHTVEARYNETRSSAEVDHSLLQYRRKILASLEEQIKETRDRAAQQIRAAKRRARRLGWELGVRQGQAQIVKELLQLHLLRDQVIADSNEQCLTLVIDLFKDLVEQELSSDSTVLAGQIARGIEQLRTDGALQILIHPSQLQEISYALTEQLTPRNITFVPDQEQRHGQVRIKSSIGSIDIDWQRCLATLREELQGQLQSILSAPSSNGNNGHTPTTPVEI